MVTQLDMPEEALSALWGSSQRIWTAARILLGELILLDIQCIQYMNILQLQDTVLLHKKMWLTWFINDVLAQTQVEDECSTGRSLSLLSKKYWALWWSCGVGGCLEDEQGGQWGKSWIYNTRSECVVKWDQVGGRRLDERLMRYDIFYYVSLYFMDKHFPSKTFV